MIAVNATVPGAMHGLPPQGDLRESCGALRLTRIVLSVVTDVASRQSVRLEPSPVGLRRASTGDGGWGLNGRALLSVLTYCYAAGVCGSEQIEEAVRIDPQMRYLCALETVSEAAVRRFRRAQRALLIECLAEVLWVAGRPVASGPLAPATPVPSGIHAIPAGFVAAARQRLDLAILIDTEGCD